MALNLNLLLGSFVVFLFSCETLIEAHNVTGFSVPLLLHRNPHNSTFQKPGGFYKPARQEGATTRVKSFHKGNYLMKITVGTPPVDMYGLFDTGSDLVWAECVPCRDCNEKKHPVFDPKKSKTYKNIKCNTKQCNWVPGNCSRQNLCAYHYGYADGSYTNGILARETITFSSTIGSKFVKDVVFGCGHNNTSTSNGSAMGIVGMGGGPLSLVSQMSTQFGGRRFSQCLVPFHAHSNFSGTISFGADSEVSGEGVVTTPLILGHNDTYYLVTLKGISVGNTFVPFNSSHPIPKGNILIDSGTPSSWIPKELYNGLVRELKAQIKKKPINEQDPTEALCYESNTTIEWPVLTLHFEGGDLEFFSAQTVVSPQKGVFCFAMAWPSDDQSIFGSFAQSNILIGFDLDKKVVSFKPTDCTKQSKLIE